MFVKIPVSVETKKALCKWSDIKSTPDLTKFKEYRLANICGKINNIIVVDVNKPKPEKDEKDGFKHFKKLMKNNPTTLTYKSKSGGRHYYFKYDEDINTNNIGVNGFSIDVLSNNNYAIIYDKLYDEPIQQMPDNVKDFIMTLRNRENKKKNTTCPEKTTIQKNNHIKFKYDKDKLVKVLNKLPSKYYNDYKHWISITSALKSAGLRDVWDEFSKKSDKYNCESNNNIYDGLQPKLGLTFINVIAKQEKIKSKLKVHRYIDKLDMFTVKADEIRNEEFIELDNFDYDEHSNILIKSAT